MSYDYKALRDAAEVPTFGVTDRVLIITDDGVRQATREAVMGALGGADIKDWDGRASRASVGALLLPFKRTQLVTGLLANAPSVPTTNPTLTAVTKAAANAGGKSKAYWTFRGQLPDIGGNTKHWVGFEAGCSDAATTHRIYIGRQVVHDLVGSELGDCVGVIEITGAQIKAKRFDTNAENTVTVANVLQKVLVQISDTTISVYANAGFNFSFPRPAGDLLIGGGIFSTANVDQTLTINVTDTAVLARTPDAGYNPLNLIDSVLPADTFATDILYARTATVFRDQLLLANANYMLAASDEVIAILDQNQVATLANENRFQKAVGFNNDYILHSQSDVNNDNLFYAGPRVSNFYNGMFGNDVLEASAVIGSSYINHDGIGSAHLYAFGQCFNALGTGNSAGQGAVNLLGMGQVCGAANEYSYGSVVMGPRAAQSVMGVGDSVIIGHDVLANTDYYVDCSIFIGGGAGANKGTGVTHDATPLEANTVIGYCAFSNSGGLGSNYNVAIGSYAMLGGNDQAIAAENTAIGHQALEAFSNGANANVAVGANAGNRLAGSDNVAVGADAAHFLTGEYNVAVGRYSLSNGVNLTNCTAVGGDSMTGLGATVNSSAFGYQATVTGNNQVQLGNSSTTTYTYGSVQSRSDARDKTGVRNTVLGLDFVLALRPVDYQWDYREDYLTKETMPAEPPALYAEPQMDASIAKDDPRYDAAYTSYLRSHQEWRKARDYREQQMLAYRHELSNWQKTQNLNSVVKDGTKIRSRFHHGFIAQEVKATADAQGVDFGGFQDHSLNGGKDVKSLGYEEFISPMVRAIQELDAKFSADEVIDKIADRVLEKIANDNDSPLLDVIAEKMLAKLAMARRG